MKLYAIRQYSLSEWEKVSDEQNEPMEDTMQIVWHDGAVCTDIMANGKRLVPILRKIEKTLVAAGLAGDGESAILGGWFGAWADSLVDPRDKKYFCWAYDGKYDREQGHWSYSWGIEQIDEGRWYIFLNVATASRADEQIARRIEERKQERQSAALWYCDGDEEDAQTMLAAWAPGDLATVMGLYAHREIVERNEALTADADPFAEETLTNLYGDSAHIYYNADGDCIAYGCDDAESGFYTVHPCDDADKAFFKLAKMGYCF